MSYRCPLCLKRLDKSQQLTRHCRSHPHLVETFDCTQHLLPHRIFCPEPGCPSAEEIENGIFLRHVGCEEHNPFWDNTRIVLDGLPHETTYTFNIEHERGVTRPTKVQHWLLGTLRNVTPREVPEMWFPLLLLRATAERDGGLRVGRLVELSGARNAGKTILAIQAMNPHGYAPTAASGSVLINNFIFSRRQGGLTDIHFRSFVETLHLTTLLCHNDREIFLPEGTPHGARNLRAAFIKPADWTLPPGDGTPKDNARRLLKMGWRAGRRFFQSDLRTAFREYALTIAGVRPYWYTIAFYDKSGEVDENEDVAMDVLDKVAVVVNAAEIFGAKTDARPLGEGAPESSAKSEVREKSLEVAVQRINRAIQRRQTCYLVVTQLDRVREQIGETDWAEVLRLSDDMTDIGRDPRVLVRFWRKIFPRRPSAERRLLEKWLGDESAGNKRQLKERLGDVEEIFFVWTDNLPESRIPTRQTKLPQSHGLARFVCRCLDLKWEQINRGVQR